MDFMKLQKTFFIYLYFFSWMEILIIRTFDGYDSRALDGDINCLY